MSFSTKRLFLFLLLLASSALPNNLIIKNLKTATHKEGGYGLKGIDFIYMINLDQRPEKFQEAAGKLKEFGIVPYRFSAVNGWELSLEAINEVGLKFKPGMTPLMATTYPLEAGGQMSHEMMREYGRAYFCHCTARGTIGCCLSHISVIKDAWDAGYETIWVMEDDVEVVEDPRRIPELIEELDQLAPGWDVLFTDQNYRTEPEKYLIASGAAKRPDIDCSLEERTSEKYTTNQKISENFKRVSARFGTHSMIIRRSGIKKLLDFALEHEIFLPYDLDNYLAPGIARYSFTFDVVSNSFNALSDNGFPAYQNKEEKQ
jgi:GR25 family glycosyltransferase involved in LPS biosynthesis